MGLWFEAKGREEAMGEEGKRKEAAGSAAKAALAPLALPLPNRHGLDVRHRSACL